MKNPPRSRGVDNAHVLLKARVSPEWRKSGEDEAHFIDRSKTAYFVSEEHPIVERMQGPA